MATALQYVYLVEVKPMSGRGRWDWEIVLHRNGAVNTTIFYYLPRAFMVFAARRLTKSIAATQRPNLRLELVIRDHHGRITHREPYGADPRSGTHG